MKCSFSDGLPEDLWQSSNTMIQGNFYERLHFYMDSCAISPTASLLGTIRVHSHRANAKMKVMSLPWVISISIVLFT